MLRRHKTLLQSCQEFVHCTCRHATVRFKNGPGHWATLAKKKSPKDKALEHFDDFYSKVFVDKWPSIRLGLLSENKYCAVVNNYSETDRIVEHLESLGAINLNSLLEVGKEKIRHRRKPKQKKVSVHKLDETVQTISANKEEKELQTLCPDKTFGETVQNGNEKSIEAPGDRLIDGATGISAYVLQEFIPATKLKGKEDWIGESEHYKYYSSSSDFPIYIQEEEVLNFPSELKIFTFEMGNVSQFPTSKKGNTGVSDYYLLDGSSVLPILALDLQPNDLVLDMCAAPGGKSLICHQTLYLKSLVCNDISLSRTNRVIRVMNEFLYDFDQKQKAKEIVITNMDAREIDGTQYDKVLVDVPCTIDRHSVHENDNNIFKSTRLKERIKLPELQSEILTNALKLVKPGGCVVYSTCSLSPVQNDGVVHMALQNIWQDTDHNIAVVDMKKALEPANIVFRFAKNIGLRYGHLVVPYLPSNFGPMYFCKLLKIK